MKGLLKFVVVFGVTLIATCSNAQFAHLVLYSEAGDPIGRGQDWDVWYEPDTATFFFPGATNLAGGEEPDEVNFNLWNPGKTNAERNLAGLTFSTNGLGIPLAEGFYGDAVRSSINRSEGHPGMSVSFQHYGCNTLTGNFTVKEFTYSGSVEDGFEVLTFVASFEQHCEGIEPALYGHFTYRAVPEPTSIITMGLAGLAFLARRRKNLLRRG